MVTKGMKGKNNKEEQRGLILKWIIYSSIYAIVVGILYGTVNYYFETIPLIFGLYMDIPLTFAILGLSGWALMSWLVLRKYKIKMLGI